MWPFAKLEQLYARIDTIYLLAAPDTAPTKN